MSPDASSAYARVAEILASAERAGEDMRAEAERRLRDRIAEADRAASARVSAAEAEALEMLAAAQSEAEKLVREATERAEEVRDAARQDAREIVAEASAAAREVLRDGTDLSGHLRELSDSLRTNAELLMRDIKFAHAEMTARLDQGEGGSSGSDPLGDVPELDVPEFHPGRR